MEEHVFAGQLTGISGSCKECCGESIGQSVNESVTDTVHDTQGHHFIASVYTAFCIPGQHGNAGIPRETFSRRSRFRAVKAGKLVFVSGTPAFDGGGKLAVDDFPAQMKQVMENMTATLKASGAGWDRVVKTTVFLTRQGDFVEMSRIYATYFPDGKFPARTTVTVAGLRHPDFLLEIGCEAVLE